MVFLKKNKTALSHTFIHFNTITVKMGIEIPEWCQISIEAKSIDISSKERSVLCLTQLNRLFYNMHTTYALYDFACRLLLLYFRSFSNYWREDRKKRKRITKIQDIGDACVPFEKHAWQSRYMYKILSQKVHYLFMETISWFAL